MYNSSRSDCESDVMEEENPAAENDGDKTEHEDGLKRKKKKKDNKKKNENREKTTETIQPDYGPDAQSDNAEKSGNDESPKKKKKKKKKNGKLVHLGLCFALFCVATA